MTAHRKVVRERKEGGIEEREERRKLRKKMKKEETIQEMTRV